ncbi:hypothetical protein PIROE2DRAFT_62659 [Piromyces sp. E2]|nr:hypothetical protein PIROE2DRAFT_62659 [Piromyces sp. E2]|eukprot:OUM61199.1 hypothetical protein PIROE2DRAFT_62659 [Piromyces sp. E2]
MTIAENNYYIIGIRRSENDKNFDKESPTVKEAIVELVNERMNNIYDIINNNKDTFIQENGELDEKLNELNTTLPIPENAKFNFINNNRPEANINPSPDSPVEYIPLNSKLVSHICPILNYYAIRAYLSDAIVEQVKQLPNIISCEKSIKMERPRKLVKPNTKSF